jgi:hypothetical protein
MEIQTFVPDRQNTYFFTLSAPATIVGATVSAIVFTTLNTTGEIVASITGTGIELSGNILAYGTEIVGGTIAASSVRSMIGTYGDIVKPVIRNSSRIGALGISVLAGATAAFTTSALVYGGKQVSSYLYSHYEDYKQNVVNKIQYPISLSTITILLIEDDILLIEDDPNIEFTIDSKHSLQDV